nr:transposase [Nocardia beijingensis]
MVDVVMSQQGGRLPEVIVTDTGSYSDIVFGLLHLLGFQYRPMVALSSPGGSFTAPPDAAHVQFNSGSQATACGTSQALTAGRIRSAARSYAGPTHAPTPAPPRAPSAPQPQGWSETDVRTPSRRHTFKGILPTIC